MPKMILIMLIMFIRITGTYIRTTLRYLFTSDWYNFQIITDLSFTLRCPTAYIYHLITPFWHVVVFPLLSKW